MAVCAHCIHRDGDLCTHPDSPVNRPPRRTIWDWLSDYIGLYSLRMPDSYYYQRGECGPVCIGKVTCDVRTVRAR